MPWRQVRNTFGRRSFGSAVSALVSELVCRQSMPRSRATSCTAKAPDEASASIKISQPSVLMSSRASRAASCGCPFEIADDHLDLPPGEAAGGVDLLHFHHHRVARGGAELRDPAGKNRRHADLDRLAVGAGDHRRRKRGGGACRGALEQGAAIDMNPAGV